MPIIKSAKKRVRVAAKGRARNNRVKRSLREALKAFAAALEEGKPAQIAQAERDAASALDNAAKKAVIHKNKAARKKAQLAAAAKAKGVKRTAAKAKPTAKKAPAKKPASAKASAGKPAAKKPAAKKPSPKKK